MMMMRKATSSSNLILTKSSFRGLFVLSRLPCVRCPKRMLLHDQVILPSLSSPYHHYLERGYTSLAIETQEENISPKDHHHHNNNTVEDKAREAWRKALSHPLEDPSGGKDIESLINSLWDSLPKPLGQQSLKVEEEVVSSMLTAMYLYDASERLSLSRSSSIDAELVGMWKGEGFAQGIAKHMTWLRKEGGNRNRSTEIFLALSTSKWSLNRLDPEVLFPIYMSMLMSFCEDLDLEGAYDHLLGMKQHFPLNRQILFTVLRVAVVTDEYNLYPWIEKLFELDPGHNITKYYEYAMDIMRKRDMWEAFDELTKTMPNMGTSLVMKHTLFQRSIAQQSPESCRQHFNEFLDLFRRLVDNVEEHPLTGKDMSSFSTFSQTACSFCVANKDKETLMKLKTFFTSFSDKENSLYRNAIYNHIFNAFIAMGDEPTSRGILHEMCFKGIDSDHAFEMLLQLQLQKGLFTKVKETLALLSRSNSRIDQSFLEHAEVHAGKLLRMFGLVQRHCEGGDINGALEAIQGIRPQYFLPSMYYPLFQIQAILDDDSVLEQLMQSLSDHGTKPDANMLGIILAGILTHDEPNKAIRTLKLMREAGLQPTAPVNNMIACTLLRYNQIEQAIDFLKTLEETESWDQLAPCLIYGTEKAIETETSTSCVQDLFYFLWKCNLPEHAKRLSEWLNVKTKVKLEKPRDVEYEGVISILDAFSVSKEQIDAISIGPDWEKATQLLDTQENCNFLQDHLRSLRDSTCKHR